MRVAAVVVAYNRRELLRACLERLLAQSRRVDEVLVIDNGSTDGAPEMVEHEFPTVHLFRASSNLGGAGGFAAGIDLAIARGHDAAWLMDDDALPAADALEPLVAVLQSPGRPAFAGAVVTAPDGSPLSDHAATGRSAITLNDLAVVPSDHATFVGVLVNLEVARKTHLPLADFFIWYDDNEYTRRLGRISQGYYVPASRIAHPRKQRTRDIGERVYYAVRNPLWICRQEWSRGMRYRYIRDASMTAVAQLVFGVERRKAAGRIARAVAHALLRSPARPPVGSMLPQVRGGRPVHP